MKPSAGALMLGLAAVRTGRVYVGYEVNPDYCRLAEERLRATQPPLLPVLEGRPNTQ